MLWHYYVGVKLVEALDAVVLENIEKEFCVGFSLEESTAICSDCRDEECACDGGSRRLGHRRSLCAGEGERVSRFGCALPAVKVIRLPAELGLRPSPASITPALTSSSLNLPMLVSSSVPGMTPASESLFALTNTMQRIVVVLWFRWSWDADLAA